MSVNEDLQSLAVSHQLYTERLSGRVLAEIMRVLDAASDDLRGRLRRMQREGGSVLSRARVLRMRREIEQLFREASATWEAMEAALQPIAERDAAWWAGTLQRTIPVGLDVIRPAPQQVWAAALSRPWQGTLLRQWVAQFDASVVSELQRAVELGYLEGDTIPQIARRIRGTRKARYTDGVIRGLVGHRARALARTATQHVAAVARDQTMRANTDIIKGYQYVATLDSRTTMLCASRDGNVYEDIDRKPELPAHWQCRSTYVPVTKSWRELGFDRDEVDPRARASMNGEVPAKLTYEEWLRKQPEGVQREALGRRRWEQWKQGRPLEDFARQGV